MPAAAVRPGAVWQQPTDHDVQPPDRKREQPVTLPDLLRPADQATQEQFRPAPDRTHLVHVHRLGQPLAQQVTLVLAQQVPTGGEKPPGGATVEDREVEREHGGVRRADGAGGHPVGDLAVRSPPGVSGEHRVQRRGAVRKRMDAAVQIPDPAARLVLAARPARARLIPGRALGAQGRLPQPVQRPEQRLGDIVGADRRSQLRGPRPVAGAQLVLQGVADRREQVRVQPQARLDQLPGLVRPACSLRGPRPQQHREGRMPAPLQRRYTPRPRVLLRRSRLGGGLHRLCHQVYHRRFGQPGHQAGGGSGRQHRDTAERLPGVAGIQPPARAEFGVRQQPPGDTGPRGEARRRRVVTGAQHRGQLAAGRSVWRHLSRGHPRSVPPADAPAPGDPVEPCSIGTPRIGP